MLLLDSARTITVDGVTVFPDHADPKQFWYLPSEVQLARRTQDKQALLTFIKYKAADATATQKGGGYLMMTVNVKLSPETERKIRAKLGGNPRLTAVNYDEGSVQCIALDLQGAGGTTAEAPPAGAFRAVEKILGATKPSLFGDNAAAFSLALSPEGATIIERAFKEKMTPVGVLYDLKFTGLRPALSIKITAELSRIYQHFSAALSGQYYFVQVGIEAGLEQLRQQGAIKIEVTDFSTGGAHDEEKKEALKFFTDTLIKDWFTPTLGLTMGQMAGNPATNPETGTTNPTGGTTNNPSTGSTGSTTSPGSTGSTTGGQTSGTTPGGQTTGTLPTDPVVVGEAALRTARNVARLVTATTNPSPATMPPAQLTERTNTPNPLPAGYDLIHVPATSGTEETITVRGGENPQVRVDGVVTALDANRQFRVNIPPGTQKRIQVQYPATQQRETFELLFDFDEPAEAGWPATQGARANNNAYNRYVNNRPTRPDDTAFNNSAAPSAANLTQRGAAGLRAWLRERVVGSPKVVTIDAHASFEGREQADDATHNLLLSRRREDVAVGIVQSMQIRADIIPATGFQEARNAGRQNDPRDRVARVTGLVGETAGPTITAQIGRDAVPDNHDDTDDNDDNEDNDNGGGNNDNGGGNNGGETNQPNTPNQPKGDPKISLRLKFLKQEELRTISYDYTSSSAVQRSYLPQGFFGLLVEDLEKNKHFLEVNLDDPFFRKLSVTIEAPFDFARIGLQSAHLALDYGKPTDTDHRRGEFIFDAQHLAQQKFETFLNSRRETTYKVRTQFHFSPDSEWEGQRFSYELPAQTTSDRSLVVNPYEHFGFLEIEVAPDQERIDRGIIVSTEVHLEYKDTQGWSKKKMLLVRPDSPPQFWRLRLSDPTTRSFTYRFVHRLKDGSKRSTESVTTTATAVAVNDPFEGALDLIFIPVLDATRTRKVFLDVTYRDDANNYRREERLEIKADATDDVRLRISLPNPSKRQFKYRLTFVGVDGQITKGAEIETQDTIISVREATP